MLNPAFGSKPSLVQRTSSVDTRRDVSQHTWMSLLSLLKLREYFVTVDHFSIWRKHLSWAKDGEQLRALMLQRFSTNMVFMSLLLGAELNVLFNSSHITTQMRVDMHGMNYGSVEFWIGTTITLSVVLTLFTLLSTFTAWGMIASISNENAHSVLRSSMGLYVCYLPSRLIVAAIYTFLIWMVGFLFILLPRMLSLAFLAVVLLLFFHIVMVFSSFGRLIMHTGAMGCSPIFDPDFEQELLPRGLHTSLLFKAVDELRKGTSVTRQYKFPARPIGQVDEVDEEKPTPTSSSGGVRFADTIWSSVQEGQDGDDLNTTTRSNLSVNDVPDIMPSTALERWVSQDSARMGSADTPELSGRNGSTRIPQPPIIPAGKSRSEGPSSAGLGFPSPPAFPSRKSASDGQVLAAAGRPPKASRPSGVARSTNAPVVDDGAEKENLRQPRSDQRRSLSSSLNSGNHTLKSLRRMAMEVSPDVSDSDRDDGVGGVGGGGDGGGGRGGATAVPGGGRPVLPPALRRTTSTRGDGGCAGRTPPRRHRGGAGAESPSDGGGGDPGAEESADAAEWGGGGDDGPVPAPAPAREARRTSSAPSPQRHYRTDTADITAIVRSSLKRGGASAAATPDVPPTGAPHTASGGVGGAGGAAPPTATAVRPAAAVQPAPDAVGASGAGPTRSSLRGAGKARFGPGNGSGSKGAAAAPRRRSEDSPSRLRVRTSTEDILDFVSQSLSRDASAADLRQTSVGGGPNGQDDAVGRGELRHLLSGSGNRFGYSAPNSVGGGGRGDGSDPLLSDDSDSLV